MCACVRVYMHVRVRGFVYNSALMEKSNSGSSVTTSPTSSTCIACRRGRVTTYHQCVYIVFFANKQTRTRQHGPHNASKMMMSARQCNREAHREAERQRERQREAERGRERQREAERGSERQREAARGSEAARQRGSEAEIKYRSIAGIITSCAQALIALSNSVANPSTQLWTRNATAPFHHNIERMLGMDRCSKRP